MQSMMTQMTQMVEWAFHAWMLRGVCAPVSAEGHVGGQRRKWKSSQRSSVRQTAAKAEEVALMYPPNPPPPPRRVVNWVSRCTWLWRSLGGRKARRSHMIHIIRSAREEDPHLPPATCSVSPTAAICLCGCPPRDPADARRASGRSAQQRRSFGCYSYL